MSDYSEAWKEMDDDQINMQKRADKCKSVLIDNLSSDDMIRIMFTGNRYTM